jgi:hypothetical protein
MYAFVTPNIADGENICAYLSPGEFWTPMIGADGDNIGQLEYIAMDKSRAMGQPILLVEFSVRRELKSFNPDGSITEM